MNARVALGLTDAERAAAVVALAEEAGDVTVLATPQTSDEVVDAAGPDRGRGAGARRGARARCRARARPPAAGEHPRSGLLLLAAGEASPDLLRQALRAGFRDVLLGAADRRGPRRRHQARGELGARGARALGGRRPRRVAEHIGGQIIAVAGAKGGVGCSTVALHVALAAAGHDAERPVAWPSSTCRRATCARCWICRATAASPTSRASRRRDHRALARRHALRALIGLRVLRRARARRGRRGLTRPPRARSSAR